MTIAELAEILLDSEDSPKDALAELVELVGTITVPQDVADKVVQHLTEEN